MDWCLNNGVKIPKLEYPAVFDHGLVGVRAIEDIEHREAFLFVPFKMLITMELARNHPEVGHIFIDHPELFSKD